jgi:ABC-type multidrug transport system fused ATPase/permease subunit
MSATTDVPLPATAGSAMTDSDAAPMGERRPGAVDVLPVERPGSVPLSIRSIFRAHRWRLIVINVLFNVENLLKLAQPLVLGLAINDLLAGSTTGLIVLVAQHLTHLVISRGRQRYDTRVYNDIYTSIATELITEQRLGQIETSRVAARSALARHYIEFFELYVPLVVKSAYSVIGAILMLGWYDWTLIPLCLGLLVPATWLNLSYSRQTFVFNRKLHDELEREVEIIEHNRPAEVREHFDIVGAWRVRLSDAEAKNFCLMELFILGVMAAALVKFCWVGSGASAAAAPEAGDIFAVFRYVMLFIMGLDSIPRVVAQWSRLRDVGGRVGPRKGPR